jgi:predicted DNA-binding protein with PD1-like motif
MQTQSGAIGAIHVIKAETGEDLLQAIEQGVDRLGIRHGAFVNGVGSTRGYHLHVVETTGIPPGNVYFRDSGAYDLLTVTGYVMDGRVHAHVTLSTDESVVGGHLEEGTEVLTFAIVTIAELSNIDATDLDSFQSA